jgi:hypothetical protein
MSYSISGNAGTAYATVSCTGQSDIVADGLGAYSFVGVTGTVTVTPTLTGYTFTPTNLVISGATSTADFTAALTAVTGTGGGVWTKQGVSLPSLSTDAVGPANQTVIYDTNPQVISANPDGKVFKMWCSSFGNNKVIYAESPDGINWTRYNTNGYLFGGASTASVLRVFKNSTTYYMYSVVSPYATITCWTSSDGITWASQGTALSASGGTNWDGVSVIYLTPFHFDGTTWYASYAATASNNNTYSGIATSTDLIHWTNGASALAFSSFPNAFAPLDVHFIGSTYYAWASFVRAAPSAFYPSDIGRSSSPDLSTWSYPISVLKPTLGNEGVGLANRNIGPPTLLEVNGKSYMYYSATPDESTGALYQVMLATADMPLAQVVATPEQSIPPGGTQLAYDDFLRGSYPENPLSDGGKWTTASATPLKVLSAGICEASALSLACEAAYTGTSWPNDQYSEVTLGRLAGNIGIPLLYVRGGAVFATQSYQLNLQLGQFAYLNKEDSGETLILTCAAAGGQTAKPASYDVWRLSVTGTTLTVYQNNVVVGSVVNTKWSSGTPGFGAYNDTNLSDAQVTFWSGGNPTTAFYEITGNAGVAGATISWSGGSTTADSLGDFNTGLLANGSYTLTPSKTGYTFSPVNSAQTVSGADITGVNFTATQSSGGSAWWLIGSTDSLEDVPRRRGH